jgi:Zn-finger protein
MSYLSWFTQHAKKHADIVKKVDSEKLIKYFRWENISKTDVEFCPLFKDNKKCHDIENLNCYLCACPNFRFDDNAKKIKSWCSIDSKDGRQIEHNGIIHQDCSNCTIPHDELYIKKHFDTDWKEIMKESPPKFI